MKEQFSTSSGRRVCFWDSGGGGTPIVLIHGNSSAKNTFENQFGSPTLARHRLIALDLPGHGDSAWADDYDMPVYVDAINSVIRALGLDEVILVGHSLGGNIAIEGSSKIPAAIAVAVFGTPIMGKPPAVHKALLPHPSAIAFFTARLTDKDYFNWAQTCFRIGFPTPDHFVRNIRRTDPNVRARLAHHLMSYHYDDEIECVKNANIPIAIFHGQFENTVSRDYLEDLALPNLWEGAVIPIKGAGHSPHIETPAAFNRVLDEFISDVQVARPARLAEAARV